MAGIKEMAILSLIPLFMFFSLAWGQVDEDFYERTYSDVLPFERKLQYLLQAKRSMDGIRNLILFDQMRGTPEKRTLSSCVLDGGMAASCNTQEAVEAGAHHRFLQSPSSPGRRKRRSAFNPFVKNLNFVK